MNSKTYLSLALLLSCAMSSVVKTAAAQDDKQQNQSASVDVDPVVVNPNIVVPDAPEVIAQPGILARAGSSIVENKKTIAMAAASVATGIVGYQIYRDGVEETLETYKGLATKAVKHMRKNGTACMDSLNNRPAAWGAYMATSQLAGRTIAKAHHSKGGISLASLKDNLPSADEAAFIIGGSAIAASATKNYVVPGVIKAWGKIKPGSVGQDAVGDIADQDALPVDGNL